MSTAESVQEIFAAMPGRLNPQAAQGLDCVIQYDLTGDGGGQYHSTIKDGAATVTPGPAPVAQHDGHHGRAGLRRHDHRQARRHVGLHERQAADLG